jgi:hypothetical protein
MAHLFASFFIAIGSLFGFHHQSQPVVSTSTISNTDTATVNVNTALNAENLKLNTGTEAPINSTRTLTPVSTLPFSTTGWKTYQDNTTGIKFEYPSGWYLEHSIVPGLLATIQLTDNSGYTLTIQACGSRCAPGEQIYVQNTTLSSSVALSFNINGFQAWRMLAPTPNGNGDPQLSYGFTFLRNAASSSNQSDFNNTSLYTPISDSLNINGIYYSVSYQPEPDIASDIDPSIINQMDQIVQTITLSPAKGF